MVIMAEVLPLIYYTAPKKIKARTLVEQTIFHCHFSRSISLSGTDDNLFTSTTAALQREKDLSSIVHERQE